jgi:hypothetical protein
MAELTRLELATFRVTGGRSNQLSYSSIIKWMAPRAGFEPATQRLTVVCSTTELPRNSELYLKENGGRCRARTYDPQFVRLMLYH